MFKRVFSIFLSLILLSVGSFCLADSGYGDNNTGADNTIVDSVNWLSSYVYNVENGYVTGVESGTSVSDFKNNFINGSNVSIDGSKIITGTKVWYGNSTEDASTVIVKGDAHCDGYVNVSDIVIVSQHLSGGAKIPYDTLGFMAADINRSGDITVVDLVNIRALTLK